MSPDRRALEARLDRLVTDNRVTIAVVFPLVGAALMIASAWGWLPPALAFQPLLLVVGALVMRLPVVATIAPLLDRRAVTALGALGSYAYLIEFLGVHTGWPYGRFVYEVALGPMLPGGVPVGLPLFFVPLVIDAYLLSVLALGPRSHLARYRLPATVAVVLAVDLALDPAAVAVGLWSYAETGVYYGVPLSNYAGWLLSATVGVVLVDLALSGEALRERLAACPFALDDLLSFALLWGAVALATGRWIPVLVVGGFGVALARLGRLDFRATERPGAISE